MKKIHSENEANICLDEHIVLTKLKWLRNVFRCLYTIFVAEFVYHVCLQSFQNEKINPKLSVIIKSFFFPHENDAYVYDSRNESRKTMIVGADYLNWIANVNNLLVCFFLQLFHIISLDSLFIWASFVAKVAYVSDRYSRPYPSSILFSPIQPPFRFFFPFLREKKFRNHIKIRCVCVYFCSFILWAGINSYMRMSKVYWKPFIYLTCFYFLSSSTSTSTSLSKAAAAAPQQTSIQLEQLVIVRRGEYSTVIYWNTYWCIDWINRSGSERILQWAA